MNGQLADWIAGIAVGAGVVGIAWALAEARRMARAPWPRLVRVRHGEILVWRDGVAFHRDGRGALRRMMIALWPVGFKVRREAV